MCRSRARLLLLISVHKVLIALGLNDIVSPSEGIKDFPWGDCNVALPANMGLNAKPAPPLRKTPPTLRSAPSRNQHTMPAMPARPAILDPCLIRIVCPLKQRSRRLLATATHQLPRNQPWSHPPASTSIDNDQVARLASRPLHPLTLADLVQYHP